LFLSSPLHKEFSEVPFPAPQPSTSDPHKSPLVLIVILNWNSPSETKAAVASVFDMDYQNFKVAIIENGSTDDSIEVLQEIVSDRVEVVVSSENLGYTGGCNLGFDLALRCGADYVWLLNSDALSEPGTLSSLIRVVEADPAIGLVSPVMAALDDRSRLLHVAAKFDPRIPSFESTKNLDTARQWIASSPDQIMLMGTALLVKVDLIRKIGGFDAALFAYWEDSDLSLRATQAGFRNVVDFNSVIYHTDKSIKNVPHEIKPHFWYYMARNETRFWRKHVRLSARAKPYWWSYTKQLNFLKVLKGNDRSRGAILAGLWHGWIGKTGAYHPKMRMPYPLAMAVKIHSEML
jgi:GT2 family glycosyltransferase